MIIASIDIGTNTILMVIAEYKKEKRELKTLLNEHNIPRIGKGLLPGNPISHEKNELLYDILRHYKRICDEYKCDKIIATATNAFRIASNSNEITKYVKEQIGIQITVVAGEDESVLAYLGASTGYNDNNCLVIDIGGGSTEIITGRKDKIYFRKSFQAGVVSFTEKYFSTDPPAAEDIKLFNTRLHEVFTELTQLNNMSEVAIAIAGTPTTLACIKQNLSEYNEDVIEGSSLTKQEIWQITNELSGLSSENILSRYKTVVKGREDVLLAGSLILFHLMNILKLDKIIVSTRGIRYGAIVKYLNESGVHVTSLQ